ncbi:excalibur calcium-binding domain-containing protein [Psychrobacter sp. SCQQ22]|nr:excalibur calcium-binding domain-containing protein [Psychrobacter sp. SCQQ22]
MSSCEQAKQVLKCGNTRLDRDKDGVPCESISPSG